MNKDQRRAAAIRNYYRVFNGLRRSGKLRDHTRTELNGNTIIEVYRDYVDGKSERIFKITQEDEVLAYEQATDQLRHILSR